MLANKNGDGQKFLPHRNLCCQDEIHIFKAWRDSHSLAGLQSWQQIQKLSACVPLWQVAVCHIWGFQLPIFLGSIFLDPIFLQPTLLGTHALGSQGWTHPSWDPCSWVPGLNPSLLLEPPPNTHQKPLVKGRSHLKARAATKTQKKFLGRVHFGECWNPPTECWLPVLQPVQGRAVCAARNPGSMASGLAKCQDSAKSSKECSPCGHGRGIWGRKSQNAEDGWSSQVPGTK